MAKDVELKKTLNLPKTDFPMKAKLPEREPEQLAAWESAGLYRTHPKITRRRAAFRPARWAAIPDRRNPPRHRPEQSRERHDREVEDHGRVPCALRSGLGLPRAADRNEGRKGTRRQNHQSFGRRISPHVPRIRRRVCRESQTRFQAPRRLRPVGQALPHDGLRDEASIAGAFLDFSRRATSIAA